MLARALCLSLLLETAIYALLVDRFVTVSAAGKGLLVLAGLLAMRALLIGLTFVLASIWRSPAPRLGPWRTLRLVTVECAVFIFCFVVVFPFERLWMGRERLTTLVGDGRDDKHLPILLVHGYGCSRAAWWWLRRRLVDGGRVVATISLEPTFASIDDYVDALAKRIDEVLTVTGGERLILVAHSMGGLVASAYLQRCGSRRVARLLTLGTPYQGSRLARFGRGENARQMRVASRWLRNLANPSTLVDCVVIFSRHDNFVLPWSNLLLSGAKSVAVDGVGHLAMLYSPRVARVLESALNAGDDRKAAIEAK